MYSLNNVRKSYLCCKLYESFTNFLFYVENLIYRTLNEMSHAADSLMLAVSEYFTSEKRIRKVYLPPPTYNKVKFFPSLPPNQIKKRCRKAAEKSFLSRLTKVLY